MKTAVAGTGYVGLVTGTCLAHLGHEVTCMDVDEERISKLHSGISPIYEVGLEDLIKKCTESGHLHFTTSFEEALQDKEILFIAVGTPMDESGGADLSQLEGVVKSLENMDREDKLILVVKSTVPVGTCRRLESRLEESKPGKYSVVSCPEFLREGNAVQDFLHPERIVIGADDEEDGKRVQDLFKELQAPLVLTDTATAEMIKYASNAFLATKISFINEIARLCEKTGADVKQVARGMGLDSRIGEKFLQAGLGYGGSCFPKDTQALIRLAEGLGYDFRILKSVVEVNSGLRRDAVEKLTGMLGGSLKGKTAGVLGLSFKPGTDDLREAPSLDIIRQILDGGGFVRAYDPMVKELPVSSDSKLEIVESPYEAASGSDAVVLVTEWGEFKEMDLARLKKEMAGEIFIDGRNLFDPGEMKSLGFTYSGMGR